MRILFKNANMIGKYGEIIKGCNICTDDEYIAVVDTKDGKDGIEEIAAHQADYNADRIINAENMLLIPGLYNLHSHLPMSMLKGYAEDMPLQTWLFDKIFPAEDQLNDIMVYYSSLLAIAEQIKNGIVSCSDMYNFSENILQAADESGVKINFARGILAFDENESPNDNFRFTEAKELYKNYHNSSHGRIKIDMSVHSEYMSNADIIRAVADFSSANGLINHTHISETKKEHDECIARHNMTPVEWFNANGFFESPAIAAHCVHISDSDMELMAEKGVTAAHCPSSNLKLASGIARIPRILGCGVNVAMGTDGSASNNNLDILKEMYLASLIQKGVTGDPVVMPAKSMLKLGTLNPAVAQGREDCGAIEAGKKADIAVLDLNSVEAVPVYDYSSALLYSLTGRNIILTMCDGKILYENGEFKTIDIEKIKYKIKSMSELYKI
jgi:5-methylthioadenosine/S-adenosylhomocysteine deaminase